MNVLVVALLYFCGAAYAAGMIADRGYSVSTRLWAGLMWPVLAIVGLIGWFYEKGMKK